MTNLLNTISASMVFLLCAATLHAAPVSISFLNEPDEVNSTCELLKRHGCKPDAISALKKAMALYTTEPAGFELTNFPAIQGGIYKFDSSAKLAAALPDGFFTVDHPFGLNCFDTVILLTQDRLVSKLDPDELAGPFLAAFSTNGLMYWRPAATTRDAFNIISPSWYQQESRQIMGASTEEASVQLSILFSFHVLPGRLSQENLKGTLLRVLQADWKRERLTFPRDFEVVLGHQVEVADRMSLTSHTGLLFQEGAGFVYLEKSGGSGPFVRIDLQDRADLYPWLTAELNGGPHGSATHSFVTFNDSRIEDLGPYQKH